MLAIFVSPHIGKYGAERSMVTIMSELKRRGVTPLLIIPKEGKICELLDAHNIKYIVVPFKNWINIAKGLHFVKGLVKYVINLMLSIKLKKEFIEEDVLFVHTNSIITSFGWQLAEVLQVPHIQHIREFGDKDFKMCFDMGKKYSLELVANHSKKVICVSEELKNYYNSYFTADQCIRVYNGISFLQEDKRNESQEFRPVMVGRLTQEKRHIDLLKAIVLMKGHGFSDFVIDIYGDGNLRTELEKYVEKEGISDQIRFRGFCSNIDLSMYNVGIIASPNEAFGRVTVEYMMNELAVVGAAGGGTKEIVVDNQTGFLFEALDDEALCLALEHLYKNRELIVRFGKAGKERAIKVFSDKSYVENILNVYSACGIKEMR